MYILEKITHNSKKVVAVSNNEAEIKERMSDELHSLNEDILDYEEDVKEIVTENMVIYGFNNTFYCYRIVEK
jgi:putative NADH-flavin reductase